MATCRRTTVVAYENCKTYPCLTTLRSLLVANIEARHANQLEHSIVALEPELDLPMAVAVRATTNTGSSKISANLSNAVESVNSTRHYPSISLTQHSQGT